MTGVKLQFLSCEETFWPWRTSEESVEGSSGGQWNIFRSYHSYVVTPSINQDLDLPTSLNSPQSRTKVFSKYHAPASGISQSFYTETWKKQQLTNYQLTTMQYKTESLGVKDGRSRRGSKRGSVDGNTCSALYSDQGTGKSNNNAS